LKGAGIPNPCTNLNKILQAHSPPIQGRFWCKFDPLPLPFLGLGAPETLYVEEHIFENCLQNKRCLAGCKFICAALGTSVST